MMEYWNSGIMGSGMLFVKVFITIDNDAVWW